MKFEAKKILVTVAIWGLVFTCLSGAVNRLAARYTPSQSRIELCKQQIIANNDFASIEACSGMYEDDPLLASAFNEVLEKRAACVYRQINEGVKCENGTEKQQLDAYGWMEEKGGENILEKA